MNQDVFEVLEWQKRTFSISCVIKCLANGFCCRINTVYGPANDDKKNNFIEELFAICTDWDGPSLTGGDFNLIRKQSDKSNGIVDLAWCDKFNNWVDECNLIELQLMGRRFTWTNNQENKFCSHYSDSKGARCWHYEQI